MLTKQGIHYCGYIDWKLRNFHGYSTPHGSSYNSYLIVDEKKVLIDTVKKIGFDEMLNKISSVINPKDLDYIVINHAEMDHSGSVFRLTKIAPKAKIVTNLICQKHLRLQMHQDASWHLVKDGDELKIGKRTLKFITSPMVHWPDNMLTYSQYDKILFSNDAFGQHFASKERFIDEVDVEVLKKEVAKYYANIVLPYGGQVQKLAEKLKNLDIDMVLPAHGVAWRQKDQIRELISNYLRWSKNETNKKVVVAYDSMWKSTEIIAKRIVAQLKKIKIKHKVFNLQNEHISDVMTELLDAKYLFLGSPIMNSQILPTVAAFLIYLKGLKPQNRKALTFGSYGWGKVGFKFMEIVLTESGFELIKEGIYSQFVPDEAWLKDNVDNLVDIF